MTFAGISACLSASTETFRAWRIVQCSVVLFLPTRLTPETLKYPLLTTFFTDLRNTLAGVFQKEDVVWFQTSRAWQKQIRFLVATGSTQYKQTIFTHT